MIQKRETAQKSYLANKEHKIANEINSAILAGKSKIHINFDSNREFQQTLIDLGYDITNPVGSSGPYIVDWTAPKKETEEEEIIEELIPGEWYTCDEWQLGEDEAHHIAMARFTHIEDGDRFHFDRSYSNGKLSIFNGWWALQSKMERVSTSSTSAE